MKFRMPTAASMSFLLLAPGFTGAGPNRHVGAAASGHDGLAAFAVFFLDQNRGWAVGSKGTLLQTSTAATPGNRARSSTEDVVRDIFFIDEQNGWMVCEVNAYQLKTKEEPRAYLMKTTDGGEHWKRIEIKGFDVDAILVRAVFSRNGPWLDVW